MHQPVGDSFACWRNKIVIAASKRKRPVFNQSKRSKLVSGRAISEKHLESLAKRIEDFVATNGCEPHLALIILSDETTASVFAKVKEDLCRQAGVRCSIYRPLGSDAKTWVNPIRHVQELIHSLNDDERVHGIAVQNPLPTPNEIDWVRALDTIRFDKDVDVQNQYSQGMLVNGNSPFWPPVVKAVKHILEEHRVLVAEKKVAIVSSSNNVARPLSQLFQGLGAVVTHIRAEAGRFSRTQCTSSADIVVSAMSKPNDLRTCDIKWGATVIDLGLSRENNKTVGDADPAVRGTAGLVTPVPGGVGPVQVAMLIENTLIAAERLVYGGTPSQVA